MWKHVFLLLLPVIHFPLYTVSGGGSGRGLGTWSYTYERCPTQIHVALQAPLPLLWAPPRASGAPLRLSLAGICSKVTLWLKNLRVWTSSWVPKCGFRSILSSKSAKSASPQNLPYWSLKWMLLGPLWSSSGPFGGPVRTL